MFSSLFQLFKKSSETREEKKVRRRFQWRVRNEFEKLRVIYTNRYGKVVNTDQAKELCHEYSSSPLGRARFSSAVYGPAKEFVERLFEVHVQSRKIKSVIFLAGGAGSGKSVAITILQQERADLSEVLVVDGTLSDYLTAKKQIETALSHKKSVAIIYVYSPILNAIRSALQRALDRGRTICLNVFTGTHVASQRTVLRLFVDYAIDKRIAVTVLNNTDFKNPAYADISYLIENEHENVETLQSEIEQQFGCACEEFRTKNGFEVPPEIIAGFKRTGRVVGDASYPRYGEAVRKSLPPRESS